MKTIQTTKELHTTKERLALVCEVFSNPRRGDKVELTTHGGSYYYYCDAGKWQPMEN